MGIDNTNVLPGVPSRGTTILVFIILTEFARMDTIVGGLAVVATFVQAIAYAEEMTGFTMGATELDIRTHFDDHVIELST